MQKRSLLAILAHPDDESFGMGGTLALYATRGVDVHLICATRGEVGEADPSLVAKFSSIAALRESELRCAEEVLGIKSIHFLDFRDSGMPGSADNQHPMALAIQPVDIVASRLLKYIRDLKPEVILTFDPIGGYRHPDHIAIHNATVKAFEDFQRTNEENGIEEHYQPEKLYFHLMPRTFLKIISKILLLIGRDPRKFGTNHDIDLISISQVDFPVHARINIRSVQKKKEQAGACHSSQGGGRFGGGFLGYFLRLFGGHESFMRAYPPFQAGEEVATDLFSGEHKLTTQRPKSVTNGYVKIIN
jgi:N-acetyl-1-D-myo-inositol-2-amino-2-deoxy-alpha-D-glucopyranoside deacetylase